MGACPVASHAVCSVRYDGEIQGPVGLDNVCRYQGTPGGSRDRYLSHSSRHTQVPVPATIGFAASVEVWQDDKLVGGLYGVNLGRAFFGESMFSLVPNASKYALIHLARMFEILGGRLIDCQFETPHLRSMGGRYIPYQEYINIIKKP